MGREPENLNKTTLRDKEMPLHQGSAISNILSCVLASCKLCFKAQFKCSSMGRSPSPANRLAWRPMWTNISVSVQNEIDHEIL